MSEYTKKLREELKYQKMMTRNDIRVLAAGVRKCNEIAELLGEKDMWLETKLKVAVKCATCGERLNTAQGLMYRDFDFVIEVDPHTCKAVEHTLAHGQAGTVCRCNPVHGIHAAWCPADRITPPAGKA